jgi:hypothetical protein
MKNLRSNLSVSLLFFVILTGSTGTLSAQKAVKEINKNYKITEGFSLGITSKYGEINVVNWEKDELSVEVIITAESSSQSKAEELLKNVEIEMSENRSDVSFTTSINSKGMKGNNKIKVVYNVKTPEYLNVALAQSYGNIYIQDITGLAELELKYGNLTANRLAISDQDVWNHLDLAYGKAAIEYSNALKIKVKYSELNISTSDVLSIESAYSKLFLGNVIDLDIESKYDKLSANLLEGSMSVESEYTQISVDRIAPAFTGIFAEMKYGNFKGGLDAKTAFRIDAEASYGAIKIPGGDYQSIKEGTREEVHGNVGGQTQSQVDVSIRYGNFVLN